MGPFCLCSIISCFSGASFLRVQVVMIFLTHHDLADIEHYIPACKLAIVSSLTHVEQMFLLQQLGQYKSFTHLVFSEALENCTFLNAFGEWLGSLPDLRYLSLVETAGLAMDQIEHFFKGLAKSKTLEFLDVSGLELGPEGALYLSHAVNQLQIKKLHARDNNFQARGITLLLRCSSLLSLNISNNNVHPGRWIKIFPTASTNLQKLIMHGNRYTENGFHAFVRYIFKTGLLHLDISHTALSVEQIIYFCSQMAHFPSLRILKMHNCNLHDNCMTAFAGMLRKNYRLEDVNITQNPFKIDGTLKMIWALQKNYTLLKLHMDSIDGYMLRNDDDDNNNALRLNPLRNETINAHLLRLLCTNQDLMLARRCWHPKRHHCYPPQSQGRILVFLQCFMKMSPLPLDLQYYILSFWMGHDLL